MNYHPYKEGYSVLPQLNRLGNENVFCIDEQFDYYIQEKNKSLDNQICVLEHNIDDRIYQVICDYIVNQVEKEYPGHIRPSDSFSELAMQLQEDLVIHRMDDQIDWFASCHICLPSSWLPEGKIGKSIDEMHIPIPGIKPNGRKLAETMVNCGPFYRYIWSVIYEDRINWHPEIPKKTYEPNSPVYVKVERQTTIPFPEIQSSLFVLREYIVKDIDKPVLAKSCLAMDADQRKYKGITDVFLQWCDKQCTLL